MKLFRINLIFLVFFACVRNGSANTAPTVNIAFPANGSSFPAGGMVTIRANASDHDGTVTGVEFFVNNVSVGSDATAPYSFAWTSVIGAAGITVKATDNSGAITTSAAVTITIEDANALSYKAGDIKNTCFSSGFCIPVVAVAAVDNVIGYDMVLHYDKTKIAPTGVITKSSDLIDADLFEASCSIDTVNGKITITASFAASAPANTKFSGSGEIFCVEFTKTEGFAFIDTTKFTITDLQESYYTGVFEKSVSPGSFSTYKDTAFNGALQFWLDNSPIAYNPVNPGQYLVTNIFGNDLSCQHPSLTAVQPDTTGSFTHNLSDGLAIDIQRNIQAAADVQPVITSLDGFYTTKFLINDTGFVPSVYQAIAMDVNMDGKISAGDRSQINQRSTLILSEFKQAWNHNNAGVSNGQPSKDWLFVNASLLALPSYSISSAFPSDDGTGYSKARVPLVPFCLPLPVSDYTLCPLAERESCTGIMLGDVTGNYSAIAADGAIKKTGGVDLNDRVIIDFANAYYKSNYVEIPVSISSDDAVNAMDISLNFNDKKLTFLSVEDKMGNLVGLEDANVALDGKLRFGAFRSDLKNLEVNKSLVSMRFAIKKKETLKAGDLHTIWAVLNEIEVSVEKDSSATGIAAAANIVAIKVYPNPANGVLTVEAAADAMVELMDASGKQVIEALVVKANQEQTIHVKNLAGGVYTMRIYNDHFVSVHKIVIN